MQGTEDWQHGGRTLEGFEALKELIHVIHELLSCSPGLILRVAFKEDDDDGSHVIDARRRLLERLGFTQILFVQCVQGSLCLQSQQTLVQIICLIVHRNDTSWLCVHAELQDAIAQRTAIVHQMHEQRCPVIARIYEMKQHDLHKEHARTLQDLPHE